MSDNTNSRGRLITIGVGGGIALAVLLVGTDSAISREVAAGYGQIGIGAALLAAGLSAWWSARRHQRVASAPTMTTRSWTPTIPTLTTPRAIVLAAILVALGLLGREFFPRYEIRQHTTTNNAVVYTRIDRWTGTVALTTTASKTMTPAGWLRVEGKDRVLATLDAVQQETGTNR
jgi:hypothetical protein